MDHAIIVVIAVTVVVITIIIMLLLSLLWWFICQRWGVSFSCMVGCCVMVHSYVTVVVAAGIAISQ